MKKSRANNLFYTTGFNLLVLLCLFSLYPHQALAVEKGSVALVIGNNDYGEDSLDNAVNDASAVAAVLKQIGFEVIERHNLNRTEMTRALKDFSDGLKISKPGLFYFAGHAAQFDGHNYLIPSGPFPQDQIDLKYDSISLSRILDRMDAARSYPNIVLLDACRNNTLGDVTGVKRGLAALDGRKGMGIIFATSPGELTSDGIDGNSPFAESLIEALPKPGQTITGLEEEVGKRVKEKTATRQLVQFTAIDVGDFLFSPIDVIPPDTKSTFLEKKVVSSSNQEQQHVLILWFFGTAVISVLALMIWRLKKKHVPNDKKINEDDDEFIQKIRVSFLAILCVAGALSVLYLIFIYFAD